jgi:hypothetical protein
MPRRISDVCRKDAGGGSRKWMEVKAIEPCLASQRRSVRAGKPELIGESSHWRHSSPLCRPCGVLLPQLLCN